MLSIEKKTESFKKDSKPKSSEPLTLLDVVSRDLNLYLDQGNDRQKRLNFLARKTDIHKRTLLRISSKQNEPSYPSIIKLYRFFFNVENDQLVFERVETPVREFLKKTFAQSAIVAQDYKTEKLKVFTENPVALDLYIHACVKKISRAEIKQKYGEFGFKVLEELLSEGLISELSPCVFSEGSKKISFSPEMIVKAGLLCIQNYAKAKTAYELKNNYMGFYAESLTGEALKEWIRIDQEAFRKKIELANRPESKGSLAAFTSTFTDTLTSDEEYI